MTTITPATLTITTPANTDELMNIWQEARHADVAAQYAVQHDSDSFTRSALATALMLETTSAVKIAAAGKALGIKDRNIYTSDSGVGFHGLTGRALMLPGEFPTDLSSTDGDLVIDARTLQTKIKQVGQTDARKIVEAATDLATCYRILLVAAETKAKIKADAAKAPKIKVVEATKTEDEIPAPSGTTVADLLRNAQNIIAGVTKRSGEMTPADRQAAQELAAQVAALSVPAQATKN